MSGCRWPVVRVRRSLLLQQSVSEGLGKDKCTIKSASSQAACPSCLIPVSDTLLPSPSALSLFLVLSLTLALAVATPSLLSNEEHPHQQNGCQSLAFRSHPPPHHSIQADTCDCVYGARCITHVNPRLNQRENFPPHFNKF